MKKLTYSLFIAAAIVFTVAAGSRHSSHKTFRGSPVEKDFVVAGVDFIQLPVINLLQLDNLHDTQLVVLQRCANDDLVLLTGGETYL